LELGRHEVARIEGHERHRVADQVVLTGHREVEELIAPEVVVVPVVVQTHDPTVLDGFDRPAQSRVGRHHLVALGCREDEDALAGRGRRLQEARHQKRNRWI
jgi:hypothetical protein